MRHGRCETCGDVATRMRVLAVEEAEDLALCEDDEGRVLNVDTGIVGAVAPGDGLLVHAGTALVREPHEGTALVREPS